MAAEPQKRDMASEPQKKGERTVTFADVVRGRSVRKIVSSDEPLVSLLRNNPKVKG
jgi:hypothetical protein